MVSLIRWFGTITPARHHAGAGVRKAERLEKGYFWDRGRLEQPMRACEQQGVLALRIGSVDAFSGKLLLVMDVGKDSI